MKLKRLRIEQLRQFRKPLEIVDLAPGLNLFCGPNESGKSTLVRAIRAAFFERHRSSSVDDLQPWGDSSATPQVMLAFVCHGQSWQLHKSFLKQKRCDLQIDNQNFNGEEAEEKLAELLGFQFPGRGASKAEHWGIPGLLWIEQGAGQEIRAAVEYAGNHLKSALGESLGEVASSVGDKLITDVERLRGQLLTDKGKPTGEYAQVSRAFDELQAELQDVDGKIQLYRNQVDYLGELRRQSAEDDAERPWDAYRQKAGEAQDQLAEVEGWVAEQQREQNALRTCCDTLKLLRDQLAGFEAQADALNQREQSHARALAAVAVLKDQQPLIEQRLTTASTAYEQARTAVRLARQHEQRQAVERESSQLDKQLQAVIEKLSNARQVQSELLDLRRQLQANRIDPAQIKNLKQAHEKLARLQIQQQAVATRVQFDLLPGQSIQLDDNPLSGQGERLLLKAADLEIAGVGRLRIQPGGEDLADLARQQGRLQDEVAALLHALAVASLVQAEEREARFRTLQAEIASKEKLLASHVPHGIEVLEAEQQTLEIQLAEHREALAALPLVESQVTLGVAEAEEEAANTELRAAEQEQGDHRSALAVAEQNAATATIELQHLRHDLQSPERQKREANARQQLIDLRVDEERLAASIEARARQIEAAQPEILRQDIQRFTAAADEREKTARQRKIELAGLQSTLETLGAQGLEEQRAELALEFERVTRRRDELACRAAALDLLLGLLRKKRQELTRRLQAPLQKHLSRYLQLLFPQASLDVDENLIPGQLTRSASHGQEVGDFDALSFGAREQMGLISRLAYADLLKEAGRPTLIILDDALVHSDRTRLDQMKRILFDAAQRHQILLFTCHPENWRDLGITARDMQALKVSA